MLACDLSEPIMPTPVFCGVLDFELIADVFRFSDGGLNPFALANDQLRNFVELSVETAP
jgi:hypothetical protein